MYRLPLSAVLALGKVGLERPDFEGSMNTGAAHPMMGSMQDVADVAAYLYYQSRGMWPAGSLRRLKLMMTEDSGSGD